MIRMRKPRTRGGAKGFQPGQSPKTKRKGTTDPKKPEVVPSRVQPGALIDGYESMLAACINDPMLFVTDVIGADGGPEGPKGVDAICRCTPRCRPDQWQVDVMRDLVVKKYVAVSGCNGAGKDTLATWMGLWMLATRPFAKGQATGPSQNQVNVNLWSEFKKWIDHSPVLKVALAWTPTRVYWRDAPDRWFLVARTAAKRYSRDKNVGEAAAEGIQGMHDAHIIIILTEASGIDDANFDAAESCCTRPDNYMFVVGNPLRRSGRFYDIFTKKAYEETWGRHYVSYLDSSWADHRKMESWIRIYGATSAFCQVRCFGRFPPSGGDDAALPWDLVNNAMHRLEPMPSRSSDFLQLGVDCARTTDEAVIAIRRGRTIEPLRAFRGMSGPSFVGEIIRAVEDAGGDRHTLIVVDETGMGRIGVIDPLIQTHHFTRVIGVSNAWASRLPQDYRSWDDEQWLVTFRNWLDDGGTLPEDDVLLAQLTTRRVEFTGKTARQQALESKDKMRARGIPSPDRAESVVLATADHLPGFIGETMDDDAVMEAIRTPGTGWAIPAEEFGGSFLEG